MSGERMSGDLRSLMSLRNNGERLTVSVCEEGLLPKKVLLKLLIYKQYFYE